MFLCHFTLLTNYCLFYSVMMPSNIITYINDVDKLEGMNFVEWKADIKIILAIMDWDNSFCEDKPIELVAEGDNDTTLALQKAEYEKAKAQ
jgi:hypothetical protein